MVIIVLSVVANFAWGYYISFFPSYLTNELHAPDWVWGLNVMLTVVGEIPFFLMFTRLFDRLGIKKILVSAIVITAVRCLLLGVCTQSWALLTASAVTGVSISLFTYCGSVYITGNIAEELHASAQTFMYAFGQGLPKVAATFLGGFLTESIGTGKTLLWCSAASALTLIASFFLLPKKMGISTAAEQK